MSEEPKISKREAAKIRLDNQFQKWLKASASKQDIQDLLAAKLISKEQAGEYEDDDFPKMASGMDELGSFIMRRFKDFPTIGEVGRQRIHSWKRISTKPPYAPFPSPTNRNDYPVLEVFDWVEKWILPNLKDIKSAEVGDNKDYAALVKKVDYENKLIEQMQLKELLMEKAEHNRILTTLGNLARNTLWELFDKTIYEKMQEHLDAAGMPEEWRQFTMAELRKISPALLMRFADSVNAEIKANEKEIENE